MASLSHWHCVLVEVTSHNSLRSCRDCILGLVVVATVSCEVVRIRERMGECCHGCIVVAVVMSCESSRLCWHYILIVDRMSWPRVRTREKARARACRHTR